VSVDFKIKPATEFFGKDFWYYLVEEKSIPLFKINKSTGM
jgi:hypothetical protein